MSILIAHPTRQHAHRLARAFQDAGLLHSFWTLLPDRRALSWLPASLTGLLPSAITRHSLEFLPADNAHTLVGPLLFQKLGSSSRSVALRQLGELMAWTALDRWVARQLPRLRPKIVVGYEMCCAETFRVAKSLGITCVLDAAAFHHSLQDKILGGVKYGANTRAGQRLRWRKDREVELADKIICVSELAKRSYIDAGVDGNRVAVNQVGCDVATFASSAETSRTGSPKFVFVGKATYHKGFDLLAASYYRLLNDYPDAELHVVGDAELARRMVNGRRVYIHGKMSHDQLGQLLAKMDCLVLPSRLESFGMVVVEALAAGVPAIVSDHAGSSDAVIQDQTGWVVPAGDESALFKRLLACSGNIDQIRLMNNACVDSAADHDWSHYSKRALDFFLPLHAGHL